MEHLDVRDATLYLTDWGGPIGLDFARRQPDRIRQLVISNTWCWPVSRDPHYIGFSLMMRSPLGQLLIKRFNAFVNRVMPMAMGNRAVLTPEVMDHYRNALPNARSSCGLRGAPRSHHWRDRVAAGRSGRRATTFTAKPALIFWGFKDIAFRKKELERWKGELC